MTPAFAIGAQVEILFGLAAGKRGIVLGPWPRFYEKGIPLWRLGFPGELISERVVRQDYLRDLTVELGAASRGVAP